MNEKKKDCFLHGLQTELDKTSLCVSGRRFGDELVSFRIIVDISPKSFSECFDGDFGVEHGLIVAGIGKYSE